MVTVSVAESTTEFFRTGKVIHDEELVFYHIDGFLRVPIRECGIFIESEGSCWTG